ncbi:MAG: hypothetical protein GEV03_20425 [Streptosporangiales bacterium]|nr:hypothetical protein [Streptosporangiales bacterium]
MPERRTGGHSITVEAPMRVAFGVVVDISMWQLFMPPVVHTEILERHGAGELVRLWALTNGEAVRTWLYRRHLDTSERRITFVNESPEPPLASLRGAWSFRMVDERKTQVERHHEFGVVDDDPLTARRAAEGADADARVELDAVSMVAERHRELDKILLSFEEGLLVRGPVRAAYEFLDEVSATKNVRLCFPHRKIVYKDVAVPEHLDALTGHWTLTEHQDGVTVGARHTAMIKPSAAGAPALGGAATLDDARAHLREQLGEASMDVLRRARDFAEGTRSRLMGPIASR